MKIEEEALKIASAKLRKLRLTDSVAIKDTPPPSKTVKSIFQDGLGGLYDDEAITYALRFGIRYYLEAVEHGVQSDEDASRAAIRRDWENEQYKQAEAEYRAALRR